METLFAAVFFSLLLLGAFYLFTLPIKLGEAKAWHARKCATYASSTGALCCRALHGSSRCIWP